jgi:hypothetical protein
VSCHLCHYITGHDPECRYFHEEVAAETAELRSRVDELERAGARRKVFVVHVYDAADRLHDYYVCQTAEIAVCHAAVDVVDGRYDNADPDFIEVELRRVIGTVTIEPGVGRRHVRCDSWRAHVDEMQVLP